MKVIFINKRNSFGFILLGVITFFFFYFCRRNIENQNLTHARSELMVLTLDSENATTTLSTEAEDTSNVTSPLLLINGIPVFIDINYELEESVKEDEAKIVPGLGDYGEPVREINDVTLSEIEKYMRTEAINKILSDRISYDRKVKDVRHPLCMGLRFDDDLPSTSVIIIFHNEMWSLLLRTIHTVLLRSPKKHLKEIILVDDASDKDELHGKLEYYIRTRLPENMIKLVRLPIRSGLMRTRIAGAKEAKGDVIVFLDSHCEAGIEWLEPILMRIKQKETTVMMPIIEWIDRKHFGYIYPHKNYGFQIGGFTWSGYFIFLDIPEREIKRRASPIEPIRTPTMLGGLLALRRDYFFNVGAYDASMEIWGGENLEMSFRVWQCGGTLEVHPCSRVGHVFRPVRPYSFDGKNDTHGYNTVRLAEVWMDGYKRFFYLHRPDLKGLQAGDIDGRVQLRKNLNCNDFKWYLENVYPEKFVLDDHSKAWGRIRLKSRAICFDTLQKGEYCSYNLKSYFCHPILPLSQYFSWSRDNELRREFVCAEVRGINITMALCNGQQNQQWLYTSEGYIKHITTGLCIARYSRSLGSELDAVPCNAQSQSNLQWMWEFMRVDDEVKKNF